MAKIYYKIVASGADGEYQSCIMQKPNAGCHTYSVGEWTHRKPGKIPGKRRRKFGPLTVFNTVENARRFCTDTISMPVGSPIFKCHIRKSRVKSVWVCSGHTSREKMTWLPYGTVLAEAVKLIEEVT